MSAEFVRLPQDAPPSFVHLRRLTDDTGLLEHALGRIPRRAEGYTTDDNARALWLATEWLSRPPGVLKPKDRAMLTELAEIYMAFLLWNQLDNGWWHNNVAYNRLPEAEDKGSGHDCQGRAIWAAADAWVRLQGALPNTAEILIQRAMPTLGVIDSRRGQAFAMAACAHMLEADSRGDITLPGSWKAEMTGHMERYESLLNREFRRFAKDGWHWFEPVMTYGNGLLPWAMLRTYRVTDRPETFRHGLESLAFLLEMMTAKEGWLRPIGNNGWGTPGFVSRWDQQPLEIFKLALALSEADLALKLAGRSEANLEDDRLVASFSVTASGNSAGIHGSRGDGRRTATGGTGRKVPIRNPAFVREMKRLALAWFYGYNDKRQPMSDPEDGSCCDGLTEAGPNINCGAESTISYLMTEALCRR